MESKIQNRKPVLSNAEGSKIKNSSQAAPRIDLKDKVTGQAQYVEDLPDLPNTAYGAMLLSPYSHARILSIDSAEALKMPGVLGIVDREHLDDVNPRLKLAPHEHLKITDDQDFVAIDKVRFDGDLVALAPGAPILHEDRGTNLLLEDSLTWGDIDEGFRQAERVFEETYTSPSMFHHPMEPIGGCLVQYLNGEVNVWLPTSSPMRDAAEFAHFLGIEPEKVRLRVPYV